MARRTKARACEHNQLGVSFFQSGAIDLAIEQFKVATKRAPRVPSYWLNLGVALLDKGSLVAAEASLKRTLSLNPQSQSAYFHLAQLYKSRGEDDAAVRDAYEQAIALDPHTYLAQRAREHIEGWRPRIIRRTGHENAQDDK